MFTALVVGSNFALASFPNIKLDASVVFMVTVLFGGYPGVLVATLSELIWSQVSPYGGSGAYLLPFLVSGELVYVGAGLVARRGLRGRWDQARGRGALFAGLLCLSTFMWDVWTNFGTALLTTNLSPGAVLFVEFGPLTLPFNIAHEVSNLLFGAAFVPTTLTLLPKVGRGLVSNEIS